MTSYREVVKKVLPAVVSIEARGKSSKTKQPARRPPVDDRQIPEEFRRFFEELPTVPDREDPGPLGFGSGFLVDPKGVILTNYHVVEGADQVEVELRDGRKYLSRNIKADPKTDLAIVRIDAKGDLPFLPLGNSDDMEIGDRVLAVGAPFGLTGSVTAGIISAKGRSLRMNMYEDFLQTDAAINPGNSGGPLINMQGEVIGVSSAIKSRSGGFQGVGLAIASNLVQSVMKQLLRDGVVHRGYLGVQIQDIESADLASRLGLADTNGVVISQVMDNAPAARAGIKDGDVVVGLAGKPVRDGRDLQMTVAALPLNHPVAVKVIRDGKPMTLQVTVEEQPKDMGTTRVPRPRPSNEEVETVPVESLGIEVADLTPDLAQSLGYRESAKGVVIASVDRNGLAAGAGLRRGMLISKVDKKAVTSARDLQNGVKKSALDGEGVLLQVQTPQGGSRYVLLKSGANP